MKDNSFAIFIPSCDNYSDTWDILSESYKKFWPDCPYNIYIITNSNKKVPDNFIAINVGHDIDWSSNCISALKTIQEKNVLMNIDDLILNAKIDRAVIWKYFDTFQKDKLNYLKLLNISGQKDEGKLIEMSEKAPYRTSTIFSLWNKQTLIDILKPGENPWQFEVNGTDRSQKYNKWFHTSKNCIKYENLIIKWVIEKKALKNLSKSWLKYTGERKVMATWKNIKHDMGCLVYTLILRLPEKPSKMLIEKIRKLW